MARSTCFEGGARLPRSSWMLASCGLWLAGLGLYFIVLRPALLPEDLRFLGKPLAQIQAATPGLERWLRLVFTVLGGFVVGAGVLCTYLATVTLPRRPRGAAWVIAIAGASTVALMSLVNFELHSDFRWVLLLPALVWGAALVSYVFEGVSRQ
jgi:hypothetical protein